MKLAISWRVSCIIINLKDVTQFISCIRVETPGGPWSLNRGVPSNLGQAVVGIGAGKTELKRKVGGTIKYRSFLIANGRASGFNQYTLRPLTIPSYFNASPSTMITPQKEKMCAKSRAWTIEFRICLVSSLSTSVVHCHLPADPRGIWMPVGFPHVLSTDKEILNIHFCVCKISARSTKQNTENKEKP